MDQPISLENVLNFLVSTSLFSDLDQAELAEIVRIMGVKRLEGGEIVFREGDEGDAWYVIFEGRAEVVKAMPGGASRQIAQLDAGACFGEIAILDGSARSATVRAGGPLTVFRFRRADFDELLDQGSLAAYKLVAGMAHVLSQRHRLLTQQISDLLEEEPPSATQTNRAEIGEIIDRYTVSE